MSELLREIEEDIRRARLENLWNRVGKIAVMVSVAIVCATVIYTVWKDQAHKRAVQHTAQLMQGMDRLRAEDYHGAITAFDVLTGDVGSSYYALAMLEKAQAQTALGDKEGALATYRDLAKQDGEDGHFAGLASVLMDDKTPIEPVEGSPFYFTQSETKAWQLLQQGKKDHAVKIFSALVLNANAPGSLRARAAEILASIAPEGTSDAK